MKTPLNLLIALSALLVTHASGQAVQDLLSEAQRAYVRGDSAAAKEKFELVRRLEPDNRTAILYLRRINAEEVEKGKGKPAGSVTQAALETVILPKVEFREASLAEALEFLKQKGNQAAQGRVAINFVVQLDEAAKGTKVTLSLQNVPFTEALKYVGELGNVQYSYERFAIVVRPKGAAAPAPSSAPKGGAGGVKVEGLN